MKRNKIMVLIAAFTLTAALLLSGCKDQKGESSATTEDSASQSEKEETPKAETAANEKKADAVNSRETLNGVLIQIDTDSFVVNKIFTEETEDGLVAVSGADPESGDEANITVSFTDSTVFTLITVLNSGINPDEDVTKTPTTKDLLKLKTSLIIKGSTTETGFLATEVGIYHFK